MNKKVILGGVVGAVVMVVISFGLLMLFTQLLTDLAVSTTNIIVSLIFFLLAPISGGFLAGRIGKPNPLRSGLIAGAAAGALILIAFLLIFGFSTQTLLSGLIVLFVWVILSRISAGFNKKR